MDTVSPASVGHRPAAPRRSHDGAAHPHHGSSTGYLALTALGVVFGDIGTSPLYTLSVALNASGHTPPTQTDVLGIISLIFWALMAMVSLKYVVFVLRADNDGEGGILALLSLVEGDRIADGRRLPVFVALGVIGAALLYGDGVITPAISVLSAMEGLKVASPDVSPVVVPFTLVILIGLFAIQRYGTASIGRLFGPVMVVWFAVLALLGVINIAAAPGILRALNPVEAALFVGDNPMTSFAVMGGVFLALTGGEALYADMGHVGPRAIRLAWFILVLPALLLNYFGQGALLLVDPKAVANPFYSLAPGWALIPMVALAALATVIASQALISGVFSLTRQAMQTGLIPRMRIVPTSTEEAGQIYVPAANWLLMAGTLLVVLVFKTSEALGAAYGIAVSGTMLTTTILLYRVAVHRWGWPPILAVPLIALFGSIDAIFLASNSIKIFEGGWYPLVVGGCIATLMLCWRKGATEVRLRLSELSMPMDQFVANVDKMVVARAPGVGVWLTKVAHGASPMLLHHVAQNQVLHETVVLLSFVADRRPRVPFDERYGYKALGHGIYHVSVRLGFMQAPDIPLTLRNCAIMGFAPGADHVHYYIAHERVVRCPTGSRMPAIPFGVFLFLTHVASRAPDFFKIPNEGLSEVGFRVEI